VVFIVSFIIHAVVEVWISTGLWKCIAFSREKFPQFWEIRDGRDLALRLEYLTNALAGEVREAANLVKKVVRGVVYGRGDVRLEDVREQLVEEVTDVFIYLLTIAGLLGIDLEKAYFQKLEKNKRRF